jgi:hypothetical protein
MQSSRLFSVTDVGRALRKGEFSLAARIGRRVCSDALPGVAPGPLSVRDVGHAVRKGELGLAMRIGHDLWSDTFDTATSRVRRQARTVLRRLRRPA